MAEVFRSRLSPDVDEDRAKRSAEILGDDEFSSGTRLQVCSLVRTFEFESSEP